MLNLKEHIRTISDYPKPGIQFYDVGTLLANGQAWRETIDRLAEVVSAEKPDVLLGIESRGFLVSSALAARLGIGLVMIRKKGKLPGKVISRSYALEYGEDVMEMQEGIVAPGNKAVLCDDLLATGGTAAAAAALARQSGINVIRAAFVIELTFLNGRAKLDMPVSSLLSYDS
ncbi:MAG: adenine phosphoribosyltransferase [Alphaproteobacteria bacterium]|nr:adenine phosphoribosyltransferase [Alphaproteobacteria bacterium]